MKAIAEMLSRKSELQITPLIDVVFLLLVYFMVTTSLIKKEADLSFVLPLPTTEPMLPQYAVEVLVEISEQGSVAIEGALYDAPNTLIHQLSLLRSAADAAGSEMVVSIVPADTTRHESIIPVMDACAAARVKNLSFNTAL